MARRKKKEEKKQQWCRKHIIKIDELVSISAHVGILNCWGVPSHYRLKTHNRWTDVFVRDKEYYLALVKFFGIQYVYNMKKSGFLYVYDDIKEYNL